MFIQAMINVPCLREVIPSLSATLFQDHKVKFSSWLHYAATQNKYLCISLQTQQLNVLRSTLGLKILSHLYTYALARNSLIKNKQTKKKKNPQETKNPAKNCWEIA